MKIMLWIGAAVAFGCTDSDARTPLRNSSSPAQPAENTPAVVATRLRFEQVGDKFEHPVYLTSPPGDARLFVVEQSGRIVIVKRGATLPTPFLDITSKVKSGGEQGLLSVAFHPAYSQNGHLFVNYTDKQGDTRIERYTVSSNADVADASSAK